ncbi:MAG: hypothetical protein HY613_05010 [Candidatus Rokubacteria bacterium]|nr:hypothetical protein [Candidatus Rokubacteria bacterium]
MMRVVTAVGLVLAVATAGMAQHTLTSPYRGQLGSEIRGLSAEEIADLREGRGMGLARAAELNGYPGPTHVLEAVEAGQLSLNPEQLSAIRQLFERMSREARRLGDILLREEQALEAAFRAGTIDEAALRARVARIAGFHGELRVVHLRTHLETRALLSEQQIRRYNQLRGYAAGEAGHAPHRH